MRPITYGKLTESVVVSLNREYGTIDDVDIDLHINIGFLDVSHQFSPSAHVYSVFAHYYSNVDILLSNIMYNASCAHNLFIQ